MIDGIRRLLAENPLQPLVIVTSAGERCSVSSHDHLNVGPTAKLVAVWHDDGTFSAISPLHIVALAGQVSASQSA